MNQEIIIKIPTEHLSNIFGQFDENVKKIEKAFDVTIVNRVDYLKITGIQTKQAERVLLSLNNMAGRNEQITAQNVDYFISMAEDEDYDHVDELYDGTVVITVNGRPVKPKTLGQKKYAKLIAENTVVFGIGPAGTGKTYLAMAAAINAFKRGEVNRIVLTRPAIEAGEKLGFLPGDLQQKVDPYLRPLYDALYEIMGVDQTIKNMEKGSIEVAPLAYMRGRTLDNSFIVLDEAQNTTQEQMKMLLTRIGFGSKAVITGDLTQIDLPAGKTSGLLEASKILADIEGIGIIHLSNKDVVRHPLVQKIIMAYEKQNKTRK